CGVPKVRLSRPDSGALPLKLFPLPLEIIVASAPYVFIMPDGFGKSPYAALPFFPPPCGVPKVRLSRPDSGALPLELFPLPLFPDLPQILLCLTMCF
ncbi:MAG TPA: hypothetical protein PLO86_09105, partial [Syntrophales bacterium]|nr:hypothetical protein [Syntrophales bacterium]